MVIDIERALKSGRLMKSLTGSSVEEFLNLVSVFRTAFFEARDEKYELEKANRKRRAGGGQKGMLVSMEEKLFFILFYLKCYPTVDMLAFFVQCDRGSACRSVHRLMKVLKKPWEETSFTETHD